MGKFKITLHIDYGQGFAHYEEEDKFDDDFQFLLTHAIYAAMRATVTEDDWHAISWTEFLDMHYDFCSKLSAVHEIVKAFSWDCELDDCLDISVDCSKLDPSKKDWETFLWRMARCGIKCVNVPETVVDNGDDRGS